MLIIAQPAPKRAGKAPVRHYHGQDRIQLVRTRRFHVRPVISGINYPAHGESFQELNRWRQSVGLNPVQGPTCGKAA